MQEWDTLVTAMFHHFLALEGVHPTWEENFFEKNIKIQGPFNKPHHFLSRMFIIDQSWNILQHCAEFPPTSWANHYPFYNQWSVT